MKTVICTVGTSLLTNREDNRPWKGWSHERNGKPASPLPDAEGVDRWLASADPVAASAETNTLHRLEIGDSDELHLLHSDTPEGRFCAERLAGFYQSRCRKADLYKIGKLGSGAHVFTAGLKSLVNIAIERITEGRNAGREPVLCATGGFKAEIAFLNLLGALLGVEVVYIHEQHRELVRLPRLPLRWDTKFVADHSGFFEWIEAEPRMTHEVESRLKQSPELEPLIEHDTDGHSYLSAAGNLLYKAAGVPDRAAELPADLRPASEKNHVSSEEHHRPGGWKAFVNRICELPWVSSVRYDGRAIGPQPKLLDSAQGAFAVCFGPKDNPLPLRVETTARTDAQCNLALDLLRNTSRNP